MAVARVTVRDLVDAGLLKAGAKLVYRRRSGHVGATVTPDGSIRTDAGAFRSPSAAARAHNGGRPVDGWHTWRVEKTGATLDSLRGKTKSH